MINTDAKIQILPMNPKIFKNKKIEEIQSDFFEHDLFERKDEDGFATYSYKTQKIALPENQIKYILFQYSGSVIASAVLISYDPFVEPDEEGFEGDYVFVADSILTFDPISQGELTVIFPEFQKFSQGAQYLDYSKFGMLLEFIKSRQRFCANENLNPEEFINGVLNDVANSGEGESC